MSERKAELEKKRKKLEELRKARDHKKKETADKEVIEPCVYSGRDVPTIIDCCAKLHINRKEVGRCAQLCFNSQQDCSES